MNPTRTSVRTVLEHPTFSSLIGQINGATEKLEAALAHSGHIPTILAAPQMAQAFRRKMVRHYGLSGLYCSNQAHVPSVPV